MLKLTAAKCPQCGADIEVNPELEKSICQYCCKIKSKQFLSYNFNLCI